MRVRDGSSLLVFNENSNVRVPFTCSSNTCQDVGDNLTSCYILLFVLYNSCILKPDMWLLGAMQA